MLLSIEEFKLLTQDAKGCVKAKDNLSKEQKKRVLDLDDWYFEVHGEHLITNYKELKD